MGEENELLVEDSDSSLTSRLITKKALLIVGLVVIGCIAAIVIAVTVPSSSSNDSNKKDFITSDPHQPVYDASTPVLPGLNLSSVFADPPACIQGEDNKPAGCVKRFVPCGTNKPDGPGVVAVIGPVTNTYCENYRVYVGEICINYSSKILKYLDFL